MDIAETSTALAIPERAELATLFTKEGGIDPIIARIEAEVRAHVPDVTTKRGRDAIASLAYKVARSKTTLDDAGKSLTEEQRRQISVVDAARRSIRDRLDALKDEARKPLDAWEAAEKERTDMLKARIARLRDAAPAEDTPEAFAALIAKVEATMIDDSWQEFVTEAAIVKDATLSRLRDAAELVRLRAEAAARAEADRIAAEQAAEAERQRLAAEAEAERARQEVERKAAAQKNFADSLIEHCEEIARGRIGGIPQHYLILTRDLEERILSDKDACGEHWPRVDAARLKALSEVKEAQARAEAAAKANAEQERAAAAEQAANEAKERAAQQAEQERQAAADREAALQRQLDEQRAATEAAAQAERDRLAAQQKAAADAAAQRAADQAHRKRIRDDIATSMNGFTDELTAGLIAAAIMDGAIPHVRAQL